ncbi:MAG TPA: AMP-binding protein, partial [Herpetosiphonaceae bacterium]
QVTVAHFVPSLLQVVLDAPGLDGCDRLRGVFCGGEALPRDLPERFFARLDADLIQFYGPTEASISVTAWVFQPDTSDQEVPIGHPIANTQIYLLDARLQPVPVGVPGELYIGGAQLARGYNGRPDLTAERFIPDPFSQNPGARLYKTGDLARYRADGAIEFLGRIDHQVKIRGFRVELGEIETVLLRHPDVREAVVLAREDQPPAGGHPDKRLVAYVVEQRTTEQTENQELGTLNTQLRAFLADRLPDYMLPSAFVVLDALPLNANGKVDRRALPAPDAQRPAERVYVAPRTELERTLTGIWRDVLRVEHVGIHDNFFELGGHSLTMVQVHSAIQTTLDREIPMVDLFKYPTIGALAAYLSAEQPERSTDEPRIDRVGTRRESTQRQQGRRQQHRAARRQKVGRDE